jgi:hypothetical protein
MAEQGWIKLYRQIRYNGLWPNGEKYSPLEAWLDLLLSANYNGNKILIDGKMVSIARGEFITSIVKLAARWGWDRKTVRRYLLMLQSEQMVVIKSTSKYTSVTIVKYDFYQSDGTTESPAESPPKGTGHPQQNPHNEEVKKEKKDKNVSNSVSNRRIIPPKIEWVKKYCEERGNGVNAEKWFNHYQAKDWMIGKNKMKDWEAAVRTWEKSNGGTNGNNRTSPRPSISGEARRYNNRPL